MIGDLPSAPAALRNREPIAHVLRDVVPETGLVLEVASGTGEHSAYFAELFPALEWQPTDADEAALPWLAERRNRARLGNLRLPLHLDATAEQWPVGRADALLCVNMVHISPWEATIGLFRGAARVLPAGAPLILYGPYRREGVPTAPSNEAFDASLRSRDPEWGLREVETVSSAAAARGLVFEKLFEMPANNLTLIYRKAA
jgi:SAM-dependent methyltransferase